MSVPLDHGAVERLYEELGRALLAYARSIVHDDAEAEDALQQVFMKLMTGRAVLPLEPRPYLFRAVRNTCLNQRRALVRRASAPGGPASPSRAGFAAPNGLDGLARDLEDALGGLPQEQREVVVLRVWGQMTLEEAAAVLGIPANTAASRYRYALAKLRQRFGAHL
ncbi:MAG TPA: sigma-70 family RNA polymerase sigma factor [Vicinamibacteria bacterium]